MKARLALVQQPEIVLHDSMTRSRLHLQQRNSPGVEQDLNEHLKLQFC